MSQHETTIEHSTSPRRAVVLPAVCWGPGRPEFYAVTVDLAADGLRLKSAIVPAVKEDLACSIRHVGHFDMTVVRVNDQEFDVRVHGRRRGSGAVAKQLLLLAEQQRPAPEPMRIQPRIIPLQTAVAVTPDGRPTVPGTILNLSASGVALYLEVSLEPGTQITVGRKRAQVARQFANGVGALFMVPLDPLTVNERTTL